MKKLVREPIYKQLNDRLRKLIAQGKFQPGQQFLTEREIALQFEVSRATANKALTSLVTEGLLDFRKGVGTFISSPPIENDLRRLVSFTEKCLQAGKNPTTKVVTAEFIETAELPAGLAKTLEVRKGGAFYLERIRLADEEPIIWEKRYLAARLCPKLLEKNLAGSLYQVLYEEYNITFGGAEQTLRAIALDEEEADRLSMERGSVGLLVEGFGYDAPGKRPLWKERTLYRGDRYEFHNRIDLYENNENRGVLSDAPIPYLF